MSTSAPTRDFTFAYFDAARTTGYVAPQRELRSNAAAPSAKDGMFSGDHDDSNIAARIRQLKVAGSNTEASSSIESKRELLRGNHSELFESLSARAPECASATASETNAAATIQLNRLLDDYMLGAKGDRIMAQMEELTADDDLSGSILTPTKRSEQPPAVARAPLGLFGAEDDENQLDAFTSMADFEKYISEN